MSMSTVNWKQTNIWRQNTEHHDFCNFRSVSGNELNARIFVVGCVVKQFTIKAIYNLIAIRLNRCARNFAPRTFDENSLQIFDKLKPFQFSKASIQTPWIEFHIHIHYNYISSVQFVPSPFRILISRKHGNLCEFRFAVWTFVCAPNCSCLLSVDRFPI